MVAGKRSPALRIALLVLMVVCSRIAHTAVEATRLADRTPCQVKAAAAEPTAQKKLLVRVRRATPPSRARLARASAQAGVATWSLSGFTPTDDLRGRATASVLAPAARQRRAFALRI